MSKQKQVNPTLRTTLLGLSVNLGPDETKTLLDVIEEKLDKIEELWPEEWWIEITRDHNVAPLMVGPYRTEKIAISAMNESLLIQGWVEEDCVECEVVRKEVVLIDQDDPDHFGSVQDTKEES